MEPDSYQVIKETWICGNCVHQINNRGEFMCGKYGFKNDVTGYCDDWKRIDKNKINYTFKELEQFLRKGGAIKLTDGTEINSYRALKKWGKEKGLDLD